MRSKYILTYVITLFIVCYSCKKTIEAPSSDFELQKLDPVSGKNRPMVKPYTAAAGQELTIIYYGNGSFQTFWPGDTVFKYKNNVISDTTEIRNYSGKLTSKHNGIGLAKKKAVVTYARKGTYKITFIATNVGDNGNTIESATNSKETITIE